MDKTDISADAHADKQEMIKNWVESGNYHKIYNVRPDQDWLIGKFNPCSLLPLIQMNIMTTAVTAILDTGAARSLISSALAHKLWENSWQSKINTDQICRLRDVNGNLVPVLGTLTVQFSINKYSFSYIFICYDSLATELLLGFDFLRDNKIAVFPNLGLVHETNKVYQIGQQNDLIFPLILMENITLNANAQEMVPVKIEMKGHENLLSLIAGNYVMGHSQLLETEIPWEQLSIFFQYISVTPDLTAQILLINHTDSIVSFSRDSLIGHAEPINRGATKQEILADPLCEVIHTILHIEDGQTIDPNESRICIDPPAYQKFDPTEINCHTNEPVHFNWLQQVHKKYSKVFSSGEFDPGIQEGSSVHFSVHTNATIIHQKFNRVNPAILTQAQEIISTLTARGLIEISDSPWSSRLLFVPKGAEEIQNKEGGNFVPGERVQDARPRKLRLVLDLRHVNGRLKQLNTNWVVPSIWSLLGTFNDAQYVSTIDLNSGFWHFRLSEKAKRLTAFTFEDITMHLTRLPQGLKISSSVMQFKMRKWIMKYGLEGVYIYIDNIIVQGPTLEIYKLRLENLFIACHKDNFRIKNKKSHHFIHDKFVLFGFELDLKTHTIRPELAKVNKIRNLPIPNTKKRVRTFIGAVTYFSNLLPLLQSDLRPLHSVAAPKTKFTWNADCEKAFSKIKTDLAKLPLLHLFRPDLPVHFFCDGAMCSHIAYCLYQVHPDNDMFYPIKYNSHKLSESEQKFSQFEIEALALIFAILKEEDILSFGNSVFHTDARSLVFITRFANATSKISRWDILLKSFDIKVHFLPNTHALIKMSDLLTRGNEKSKFKNRVTEKEILDFMQIDFDGIPLMSLRDTMFMIRKALDLIEKAKAMKPNMSKIQSIFPDVPMRIQTVINREDIICFPPGNFIGQVDGSTEFRFEQDRQSILKSIQPHSLGYLELSDQINNKKLKIREAILTFLPQVSRELLIEKQQQTLWIQPILFKLKNQKSHLSYYLFEGILMRKHQLNNSIYVDQIVMPDEIGVAIIEKFHSQNFFSHMGSLKMARHLNYYFHIRRFIQIADEVIKNCTFCSYNKIYANRKLIPGLKIHINAPRHFLYLDICTIKSSSKMDSFLTILDGFSRFVLYLPISRNATAQEICSMLFSNWIRHYAFPLVISTDGGSAFSNRLMGEVAILLNCKVCRIAGYNSKSNLSERWNKFAIAALKIFHQSYTITDENFDLILALTGNMMNAQILPCGYSPFYLHTGARPKTNEFVSFQSLQTMQDASGYAKNLVQVQNVLFVINERNRLKENKRENGTQLSQLYKKGDFVLLRKLAIGGPRNLHKVKPVYHSQPYRILKRTKTNAIIFPFTKRFLQNRFKGEGKIPKNYCSLQKISNLKPIRNVYKLLNLSITQRMVLELDRIITMEIPNVQEVEITPNMSIRQTPDAIVNKFNPSLKLVVSNCDGLLGPQKLQVQQADDASQIKDICIVDMQTYNSKMTMSSKSTEFQNDTLSEFPTCTMIPRKKPNKVTPDTTNSSESLGLRSFDLAGSFCSIDDFGQNGDSSDESEQYLSPTSNSEKSVLNELSTPDIQRYASDELLSVRPTLSGKKSVSNRPKSIRTETRIQLPSGNALSIISSPRVVHEIVDKMSVGRQTKPITINTNPQPGSMISDISKSLRK